MNSQTIAKISTLIGILAALASAAIWVFGYHATLSTKKEVNLIYIELRLKDAEDSVYFYSQRDPASLNSFEQARFERIQASLVRLEAERDKVLGLGQ